MNFSRIFDKQAFAGIIFSVSGLRDPGSIQWANDPQSFVSPADQAQVTLKIMSVTALNVDEHRSDYNPAGYPAFSYVTTEIGNRIVKVSIKAEAYEGGAEAAEIIDHIRTGIRAATVRDALNNIGIAYNSSLGTVDLPTRREQRVVSCASCEFEFGGIARQVSSVTTGADWIATVNGGAPVPGSLS